MKHKLAMVTAAIVLLVGGITVVKIVVLSIFDSAVLAVKEGRYEIARPKLEWFAMFGDVQAQLLLGDMYAFGWGVSRGREEAIRWYRHAAYCAEGLKDPAACSAYYVGQNFLKGLGVERDPIEAAWWIQFAKDGGYSGSPR
jgi:TPR repeat protein